MLKPEILLPLLKLVKENPGVGSYQISGLMKKAENKVRYWLASSVVDGFLVKKEDGKFHLKNNVFLIDNGVPLVVAWQEKYKTFCITGLPDQPHLEITVATRKKVADKLKKGKANS